MEGCCPNAGAVDDGCPGLSADSRLLRQPLLASGDSGHAQPD